MHSIQKQYHAKNNIEELTTCFIQNTEGRKAQPKTPEQKQQDKNRQTIRALARAANNNFGPSDYSLVFTFSNAELQAITTAASNDRDKTMDLAQKKFSAFLRRLRRQSSQPIKYIAALSDTSGKTRRKVRPHIHVMLSSESLNVKDRELRCGDRSIATIWGHGNVHRRKIRAGDLTGLVCYFLSQTRTRPHSRRFFCSQSLEKIQFAEVSDETPIEIPADAEILELTATPMSTPLYARYTTRPEVKEKQLWQDTMDTQ